MKVNTRIIGPGMKSAIPLLIFFAVTVPSYGANPFWVRLDKKIIFELNSVDKYNPLHVESYFLNHRKLRQVKENLGFGWQTWTARVGGGYISVGGTFIYFNDSIVSYRLYSRMPQEKRLAQRYAEWLGQTFEIDSGKVRPLEFNVSALLRPLSEYDGQIQSMEMSIDLLNYMSPFSGTMYGYAGGLPISLLPNRRHFKNIQTSLSTEEVYLLMFSINPASRLTAIEYYKRYQARFVDTEKIDRWIESVYSEVPVVHTLMGCFGEAWKSRLLVEFCLEISDE